MTMASYGYWLFIMTYTSTFCIVLAIECCMLDIAISFVILKEQCPCFLPRLCNWPPCRVSSFPGRPGLISAGAAWERGLQTTCKQEMRGIPLSYTRILRARAWIYAGEEKRTAWL